MEKVNRILEAARELQSFCEDCAWKFCFIGGLAVQRWGEVRNTQDADLTILSGFGNEETFVDPLLEQFTPRRPDAREFALIRRVLTVYASNGVPLDIALGALEFEQHSIERSSFWEIDARYRLRICSAEDLIVHKTFAGRDIDWIDVRGILVTQGARLDLAQVRGELVPLLELKEDNQAMPRLARLCEQCGLVFPGSP